MSLIPTINKYSCLFNEVEDAFISCEFVWNTYNKHTTLQSIRNVKTFVPVLCDKQ